MGLTDHLIKSRYKHQQDRMHIVDDLISNTLQTLFSAWINSGIMDKELWRVFSEFSREWIRSDISRMLILHQ